MYIYICIYISISHTHIHTHTHTHTLYIYIYIYRGNLFKQKFTHRKKNSYFQFQKEFVFEKVSLPTCFRPTLFTTS